MRVLLLVALATLAGCGSDSLEFETLLDPSPFDPPRDPRIETDTHVDAVATGAPVTLRWTAPGGVSFLWALEAPAASAAALSDPTAAMPVFTPDVAGVYDVGVRVIRADGTSDEAVRRITAASYVGEAECARCHVPRAEETGRTPHATTVERLGAILFANPGCQTCHVLDPVPTPVAPAPGSFTDVATATGFDPTTYTTFDAFEDAFPTVADRASVQCESCHGPGSRHNSDPRRIGVSLRASLCGACHDGTVGPDRQTQWESSAHGREPPAAVLGDASCQRCHLARSFLASVAGAPIEPQPPGSEGVTCAVCHDPHADAPAQVRLFGAVPITSGRPYNGGRAATCLVCHQSDVPDPAAHADANDPFPCAVQADMLSGQGAVEFGFSFSNSFHGTTVFRRQRFTGDPDDPDTPDACVICHMAEAPAGPLEDVLGGHALHMQDGAIELATGNCDRCHTGLATFDFEIGEDFDGDGRSQGVQTEIGKLVEVLFDAIRRADVDGAVDRPGGALTPAMLSPDPTRSTPLLRQAVYNYNFAVTDGSLGVHNTTYCVQVLQRTWEQLEGTPFGAAFPEADVR